MPSMNVPKVPEGLRWEFYIGKVGTYELALPEGINGQSIILKDKYLNKEVDLSLKTILSKRKKVRLMIASSCFYLRAW